MQQLLTGKKRLPGFSGAWKTDRLGKLFFERKETNCKNLEMLAITVTQGNLNQHKKKRPDFHKNQVVINAIILFLAYLWVKEETNLL